MNSYELSRNYFDWCFENPEKISVNHTAIYFFAIEHCNRLGWKAKFGFPTQMVMDALGIKKHQTYIRYFNELVEFGFIELIQKSQNQYSSNIISLNNDVPKNGKALDKAIINHRAKQIETIGQSNGQSNSSIDKPINKEPLTTNRSDDFANQCLEDNIWKEAIFMQKVLTLVTIEFALKDYNIHLIQQGETKNSLKDYKSHFVNWVKKRKELKAKDVQYQNKDRL